MTIFGDYEWRYDPIVLQWCESVVVQIIGKKTKGWKRKGSWMEYWKGKKRVALPVIKRLSEYQETIRRRYQKLVDETFVNNDMSIFCQELRNYATHSAMPKLHAVFRIDSVTGVPTGIYLTLKELKEYNRWTAPARRYIEMQTKDIHLLSLVNGYNSTVVAFMDRLALIVHEVFCLEFSELSKLQELLLMEYRKQGVPIDAMLEKRWDDIDK